MNLYLNELAPWERKSEYLHHIEFGKTTKEQLNAIRRSNIEQTKALLKNADAIIASQDSINDGLKDLDQGLNHIATGIGKTNESLNNIQVGIDELQSTFEWGIGELIWHIQESNTILNSIEKGVWNPFDAQAKNRIKQAQESFNFGWYEEAEKYFLKSEEILETDYYVHFQLGLIYLFHIIDKNKAFERFNKAYKYSLPKDEIIASKSLHYKALVLFDFGKVSEAIQATEEAINLNPIALDIYYQNAQYNAQIGNFKQCIDRIKFLGTKNFKFLLKVNNDPLFSIAKDELIPLFKEFRDLEKKRFEQEKVNIDHKLTQLVEVLKNLGNNNQIIVPNTSSQLNEINNLNNEIEITFAKNSYLDLKTLNLKHMVQLKEKYSKLLNETKIQINSKIYERKRIYNSNLRNVEKQIDEAKKNKSKDDDSFHGVYWTYLLFGSHIIPALIWLLFSPGWEKLWTIPSLIPIVSLIVTGVSFFDYFQGGSSNMEFLGILFWGTTLLIIVPAIIYSLIKFDHKNKIRKLSSEKNSTENKANTDIQQFEDGLKSYFKILDNLNIN
jgi:hypothetical protein